MLRHKVKPGITGLAQVSGWRGETDTLDKMLKRVECDHQYIRDWSPWLDYEDFGPHRVHGAREAERLLAPRRRLILGLRATGSASVLGNFP